MQILISPALLCLCGSLPTQSLPSPLLPDFRQVPALVCLVCWVFLLFMLAFVLLVSWVSLVLLLSIVLGLTLMMGVIMEISLRDLPTQSHHGQAGFILFVRICPA
jgi:hypothetical protein